jgi:hypothetical protein
MNGVGREGCRMEKGNVFIWILVIGLGIFAIASFFIYAGP